MMRAQTQMVMEMQWSHHQAVRTEKPSCTSSDECNCVVCDTHNNGRWIQCDICDSWCHFKCANIPDNLAAESSAESLDWQCPKCNWITLLTCVNVCWTLFWTNNEFELEFINWEKCPFTGNGSISPWSGAYCPTIGETSELKLWCKSIVNRYSWHGKEESSSVSYFW